MSETEHLVGNNTGHIILAINLLGSDINHD